MGSAPGAVARKQQLGELGRKRAGRVRVRPVVWIGLVATVCGVRHRAARLDEQALELVPLRQCVNAGADARNLNSFIDDGPFAEAFDENRVGVAGREGGDAPAAFRAPRGSRHGDAPHRFAARKRLADEQVDMRLQEAAGAELEDREFGHELNLDQRLDDAGFGFDPEGKAAGRLLERDAVGDERRQSARDPRASRRRPWRSPLASRCGCPRASFRACETRGRRTRSCRARR